jgi:hypothetical protein
VIFINRSDQPVRMFWLDMEGKRRDYGVIQPHGLQTQSTYVTHAWLLEGPGGEVLGIYVPGPTIGRVVIEPRATTRPAGADRPLKWPALSGRVSVSHLAFGI